MASDPALAEILVVSATWGSAVGVAVDFSWSFTKSYVAIRGEDSIDPDQQGLIAAGSRLQRKGAHRACAGKRNADSQAWPCPIEHYGIALGREAGVWRR